jgi:phosphotriesterase-related protein
MERITTVLGDISPGELGFCQSHEHLSITGPGESPSEPEDLPVKPGERIDDWEKSRREAELYRGAGGDALVDAQPLGCGRDAAMLRDISEKSGVRIIASTGFHKMSYYPEGHWIHTAEEDALAGLFIAELREGMYLDGDRAYPGKQGPGRAGQIKTALDTEGLSPRYQRLFRSAVKAAGVCGCAIMVHIENGADPLGLSEFLFRLGAVPNRLIFCHLDRAAGDIAVHREICARGITLEYDTVGRPKYHDDEREAAIITEILEAGYERQILISLDTTRARLKSYGGSPGLAYIRECFIPLLRRRGVSEARIEAFFHENPARIFARPAEQSGNDK